MTWGVRERRAEPSRPWPAARRRGPGTFAGLVMLLALTFVPGVRATAPPRVYVILIDGLDARRLDAALTPTLWELATGGSGTFYPDGRAVMPTVTNTNHASIMTGVYAQAHGIVGNAFWAEGAPRAVARSEAAAHLEVETLFTVVEKERPRLVTAALFGKQRLVALFAAAPDRQRRPDVLWGDAAAETEAIDRAEGFASDRRTMDATLETLARDRPDFVFVALPDVDRTSHVFGPDSHAARRALLTADEQITRLVSALKRSGEWDGTVLMVTADHGFDDVAPDPAGGRPYPVVTIGAELARAGMADVGLLAGGGLETVRVGAGGDVPAPADQQRLAEVRAVALAHPGVAEAWYRVAHPQDGGDGTTVASAHPDWRMSHPRMGDLVLVAKPGYQFADPFSPQAAAVLGTHGGPNVTPIPILISGGHPWVRAGGRVAADGARPTAANPDLGATVAWLLDVRFPRTVAGAPVARELRGRVLEEAFAR